jgi:hypothetical protein
MSQCRYVEGYGYYLRAHELNCRDKCDGCQPCTHDDAGNPVRHCTARERCTSHLNSSERLTCATCIGRTRQHLAEIVKLHAEMSDEAAEAGVNSEAAVLAGPAADPEQWSARRIDTSRRTGTQIGELDPTDPQHPLTVLGTWDFMLREDYDQPTDKFCTVVSAAAYLDGLLTRLAQDPEQDWPLFAREVSACRSHLADVLHESRRPERGAPCPSCEAEPPLVKHYNHRDLTGATDEWRCSCGAKWTEAEYRLWVADDYLVNAEVLTASEIQMAYGIKPGTLRKWAERKLVAKCGRNARGQQTYDVAQARKMHEHEIAC